MSKNNNTPEEKTKVDGKKKTDEGKKKIEDKSKMKTVVIEKDVLDKILNKIESQDKEIEILKKISDKNRLERYEKENEGEIIRRAKVGLWDNKIIIGWKKGIDDVGFIHMDGRSVLVEKQTIVLILDDGGKTLEKEVNYLEFSKNINRLEGDIINEKRNLKTGVETKTLQFDDGKEVTIDVKFLNP